VLSAAAAITIWIAAPTTTPRSGESPTAWFDVALSNVMGEAYLQTDRPATLRNWFEAQVSHDLDVPAIPGADLQGGRFAYLGGIRGAAIEYRLNDLPLTYLMVPDDVVDAFANLPDSMVTWMERGHRIVMWRQDGTTRALVAPMPRSELIQIAEHCRRTMI
jgi:anti-sigma factor RsiW